MIYEEELLINNLIEVVNQHRQTCIGEECQVSTMLLKKTAELVLSQVENDKVFEIMRKKIDSTEWY